MESGRYHFHSRVDLQSYQTSGSQHAKDKKGKKKRKEPEWSTANEYKVTSELLGKKVKMENLYYFGFFIMRLRGPGIWCLEDVCLFSEREMYFELYNASCLNVTSVKIFPLNC